MAALVRGLAYRELGRADSAIAGSSCWVSRNPNPPSSMLSRRSETLLGEQWAKADPALQVRVREVRQRMAKLQGESG